VVNDTFSSFRIMPAPAITVVIVNFDGGSHVLRCLECLAAQTLLPERIVLVDNASCDGSLAACRRLIAADSRLTGRVVVEPLSVNVGFAAGSNRGIALTETELVALLNPDAFPEPGWLAALGAAAGRHPECAAFGSRQMLAGSPEVLDGIGDRWHFSGLAWREGHGRRLEPRDLEGGEIFTACAAAALYRRQAVLDVGGFDEDYFCYGEDVDLGYRLRLVGHTARYVPGAVVEHVGGGSGAGGRATYYGHRNLVWTVVKNTPGALVYPALLAHFLQSILTGLILGYRGRGRAFARGKWDAAQGLGRCWQKRQGVQASRRVSPWTIGTMWDLGCRRTGR
jgi:GT2 family glycosyltransferase